MSRADAVTADDLNAFVDAKAAPDRISVIEEWLAGHPDDAATVWAYRSQNSRLHESFDRCLDEAVPATMLATVAGRIPVSGRTRTVPGWMRIAAAIALLVAGAAGGWFVHGKQRAAGLSPVAAFADHAIGAHRVFAAEIRHPVEVVADQEAHLVAWLSKRLGTKLSAPSLTDAGFNLVGGRLLAEGSSPAAQLMYENAAGQRVTLYIRSARSDAETSFRFAKHDGVSAFYWIDRAFAYAIVAPLERDALMGLAQHVYSTLEPE